MKTDNLFSSLCSNTDFDIISGEDCVKVIDITLKGKEDGKACCLWHPLILLDKLMAEAKEAELRVNGIEKVLNVPEVKEMRVFKGDFDMSDIEVEMKTTATSIIYQYKAWKLSRERFLKGQLGSFYDFGELANLIANLVIITGCETYTQLYLFLKNLILTYSLEHNSIEGLFYDKEQELKTEMLLKDDVSYAFLTKKQALQTLQYNSRLCNIYNIAFVYAKLSEIVAVELKINELIAETFKSEV